MVVAAAAFGIGWTNSGADYSRYLPRGSSGKAIVAWTTFAGSLMPSVLVIYGLMLVTSDPSLVGQLDTNPIGALMSLLPTSALILLLFLLALSLAATVAGRTTRASTYSTRVDAMDRWAGPRSAA